MSTETEEEIETEVYLYETEKMLDDRQRADDMNRETEGCWDEN